MDYVTVGATGVRVSSLCFGTMSFGAEADEATSAKMFGRRWTRASTSSTSPTSTAGASEEILGRIIADRRDAVVITSKAFFPTGPDVNARGASRRHVVRAVEASHR